MASRLLAMARGDAAEEEPVSERERQEIERRMKARAAEGDRPADEEPGSDWSYQDPEVELPGEDDYIVTGADVGDANKSRGTDRVGGYGNRAVPQEPGPSQDH
jgi:hypothetical protein